ncbi:MAG: sensor histidine kinase [Saprospiraceae bacterium]|nr:sensor histidine kinase [Saprospiraceae bacterium]
MGYIIIKEITKLLGAPLTIQSEINKGTDVWVEFSNL